MFYTCLNEQRFSAFVTIVFRLFHSITVDKKIKFHKKLCWTLNNGMWYLLYGCGKMKLSLGWNWKGRTVVNFSIFCRRNVASYTNNDTEEIQDLFFGKLIFRSTFYGSHNCNTSILLYRFKLLMKEIMGNLVVNDNTVITVWSDKGLNN